MVINNYLDTQWTIQPDKDVEFDIDERHYSAKFLDKNILKFTRQTADSEEEKLITLNEAHAQLSIRPALYENPFLLKFNTKIELPSKDRIVFFACLPVYFEIVLNTKQNVFAFENTKDSRIPKTFHGNVTDGMLCYLNYSDVYFFLEDIPSKENTAILPVEIYNRDQELHEITKMIIRRENTGIFLINNQIYTNRINISLHPNQGIDVVYASHSINKKATVFIPVKEHKISHSLMTLLPGVVRRGIARDYGF